MTADNNPFFNAFTPENMGAPSFQPTTEDGLFSPGMKRFKAKVSTFFKTISERPPAPLTEPDIEADLAKNSDAVLALRFAAASNFSTLGEEDFCLVHL